MDAATHLGAAWLSLATSRPYLNAALWAIRRVPCFRLGTVSVDSGWRLYYDPEAILSWTVEELGGVIYHEVFHLLRAHAQRGGQLDSPSLWNVAADAEINDDIRGEGMLLPSGAIFPHVIGMAEGLLAEDYYAQLLSRAAAGERLRHAHGPAEGDCGSAATGRTERESPLAELDQGAGRGLSEEQAAIARQDVARAVRAGAQEGRIPAHWQRWAEAHLEPRVDWRRELAACLRLLIACRPGRQDYSYARPSRRQSCYGRVVAPAMVQLSPPAVAVVVDTSGSMSESMLSAAVAEIGGILQACGLSNGVRVLAVDSEVQACSRVFRKDQIALVGGGGTDMCVGLAAASRLMPRPNAVVVITDGHTPWPAAPADIPTIVVKCDPMGVSPAWARTIEIDVPNMTEDGYAAGLSEGGKQA
jgi:predicted metal-dependent peptidase